MRSCAGVKKTSMLIRLENKKWAFVSDVARIYALKEYGGIYMDTDMMITKDVSDIVKSDFFVGWESELNVAVGVLGVKEKHHPVIEELYDFYSRSSLNMTDLFSQSIPRLLSTILRRNYNLQSDHLHNQYLEDGIVVYARDYFYPISSDNSPDMFTENTCMIHYYTGSWLPRSQRIRNRVHEILGERPVPVCEETQRPHHGEEQQPGDRELRRAF